MPGAQQRRALASANEDKPRSALGYDGPASKPPSPTAEGAEAAQGATTSVPASLMVEVPKQYKNLELPSEAYRLFNDHHGDTKAMTRPGFVSIGKEVKVSINTFLVNAIPNKRFVQYQVLIGSGAEKRGLIRAVWESKRIQSNLCKGWMFDGNSLAWVADGDDIPKTEVRAEVDLDEEKGVQSRPNRSNKHRFMMRPTKFIDLQPVKEYLRGRMSFDNSVLEAINVLDHLLRETPSKKFINIKRSYFLPAESREKLYKGVTAGKGVYQSMRLVNGGRLSVNADVSNAAFWASLPLHELGCIMVQAQGIGRFGAMLDKHPHSDPRKRHIMVESFAFNQMRKFRKVRVFIEYKGSPHDPKQEFIIDRVLEQNSNTFKFPVVNKETGVVTEEVTLADYFEKKYNVSIEHKYLPVVQLTKKKMVLPMELLRVAPNQKYPFKLDDEQTASMIKFAVNKPVERKLDIENGLKMLDWKNDPYLKQYGLDIEPRMTVTNARLLPAPTINFGNRGTAAPGTSGKWDLRGKRFFQCNTQPLTNWGVVFFAECGWDETRQRQSIQALIEAYKRHGGDIRSEPLTISGQDPKKPAAAAEAIHLKCCTQRSSGAPQLLVFMLKDRNSWNYQRIKKVADCRLGVLTQCLQSKQAIRLNAQYFSNVSMKINAKLGGTTSRVRGSLPMGHFKVPSMVIGADVSHPAPGSAAPSTAAVTCSLDLAAARYGATVQVNGFRVEIISEDTFTRNLFPLANYWAKTVNNGNGPAHVYYFRDGVSSGQHEHVLDQEVKVMRKIFKERLNCEPKFVVVICSKRHHIRFFAHPGAGTADQNPHPGVLVERDVTHPFENDAYLCSHRAIQGTARPTHYHILLNETNVNNAALYTMIYEQCYTYIRATTPVSLYPAVYYAHLASNRARCHEDVSAEYGPRGGELSDEIILTSRQQPRMNDSEMNPLLPMNPETGLTRTMWYI